MIVALTLACDPKTPPKHPGDPIGDPVGDPKDPTPPGEELTKKGPPEEEAGPECPAETADLPTPLWGDTVLVRMPKGVEMVERNEVFAQASGKAESTCGAMVTRAAMGYFQDDTSKQPSQLREETLAQIGFDVSTLTWSEENESGRNLACAYEAPADDQGNPPVKGWFQLKEHNGNLFWLILEAHPNAFGAIAPSFKKSASTLLFTQ